MGSGKLSESNQSRYLGILTGVYGENGVGNISSVASVASCEMDGESGNLSTDKITDLDPFTKGNEGNEVGVAAPDSSLPWLLPVQWLVQRNFLRLFVPFCGQTFRGSFLVQLRDPGFHLQATG